MNYFNPLSANPTKWPNTLKQFGDELFECVWPFCEISAKRVKSVSCYAVLTLEHVLTLSQSTLNLNGPAHQIWFATLYCVPITCSKSKQWRQWRYSGVFIFDFEHISHPFVYCFYCWLCNSEIQVFKKNLLSTLTHSYKESTFTKKCIPWPYWNLLEHLNFNIWSHLNLVYILRSFSILEVLSQNIFSRIEHSWHIFYNITDITKVIHSTNNRENSFKLIMQFLSTKHTKKPSSK